MKRDTFISLLMTVEDFNEKIKQLETFTEQPSECLNKLMCQIIDTIDEDTGLNKFDDTVESVVYDFCFRFNFGQDYNGIPLVTIDGKDYFPKRFTELYDVVIEIVGDANQ